MRKHSYWRVKPVIRNVLLHTVTNTYGYTQLLRTIAFLNPHIIVHAFHTNTPHWVPVHFLITSLLYDYSHSSNARVIPVRPYTVEGVKTANTGRTLCVSPPLDVEKRASGVIANVPERIDKNDDKGGEKDEKGRKWL